MTEKDSKQVKDQKEESKENLFGGKPVGDLWTNSLWETLTHNYMIPVFEYLNKNKDNKDDSKNNNNKHVTCVFYLSDEQQLTSLQKKTEPQPFECVHLRVCVFLSMFLRFADSIRFFPFSIGGIISRSCAESAHVAGRDSSFRSVSFSLDIWHY